MENIRARVNLYFFDEYSERTKKLKHHTQLSSDGVHIFNEDCYSFLPKKHEEVMNKLI